MAFFQLRRITSAGHFIPEIDGIRFIAIASVVVFHLGGFLYARDVNQYTTYVSVGWLKALADKGHLGVPLFFVLSGMILGLPFARHYLIGDAPVSMKNYFVRRLTRLEPPYILSLTILLAGSLWVVKNLSIQQAIPSYFSSLFYIHNLVYGRESLPLINCVTWSLEVEVQFYVLAPLLAKIFSIPSIKFRRILLLLIILLFTILPVYIHLPFISLFDYLSYFLLGFLLADMYVITTQTKVKYKEICVVVCLICMFSADGNELNVSILKLLWQLLFGIFLFLFCYLVVVTRAGRVLTRSFFTHIGGMCYSIYLLHFSIISVVGGYLMHLKISGISIVNQAFYVGVLLSAILFISAIFYILIERPCMKKDWHKSLMVQIKSASNRIPWN